MLPKQYKALTIEQAAILCVVGHDNMDSFDDYEVVTASSAKHSDDDAFIGHIEIDGRDFWIYEK